MFLVGLSMLSLLVCLFLKMINYCSSYAMLKFGDEIFLCSILELCDVLMKTNDRFLFAIAC